MLLKYLCCTNKHSNMRIMTTSMHLPRDFTFMLPLDSFLIQYAPLLASQKFQDQIPSKNYEQFQDQLAIEKAKNDTYL